MEDQEPQLPESIPQKRRRIGKIMIDRNLCIGAASCVAVAPSAFEIDVENKAVMRRKQSGSVGAAGLEPPPYDFTSREDLEDQAIDDETLLLAAQSCPVQAIIVYDEEGEQMYP